MPTDLTIRPAVPDDLPALAEVYLETRRAAVPAMPPIVHTPEEVRRHVGSWDLADTARAVWVAESDGEPVGFATVDRDWLDSLYVVPRAARRGVGSAMLDLAKAARPDGFCLWVFEANEPARRFYRERGLIDLERTDGSANEERTPDVRMAWPGREPLPFLRRLIDEVDAELGDLLARRAALTRAVQDIKHDTNRDSVREAEIAAELARRAPALGADRTARIIDAIITESLAAAEDPG